MSQRDMSERRQRLSCEMCHYGPGTIITLVGTYFLYSWRKGVDPWTKKPIPSPRASGAVGLICTAVGLFYGTVPFHSPQTMHQPRGSIWG
ncbi:hypothetical protein QOT17_005585 [Balamuthia mandrillaris]